MIAGPTGIGSSAPPEEYYPVKQAASGILYAMQNRNSFCLAFAVLMTCGTLCAQQPRAIANDPAPDAKSPSKNLETVMTSHGSEIMGIFLLASGTQPHGTVILLHGFKKLKSPCEPHTPR